MNILDEAKFENQINTMTDRQLAEFTARQVYDVSKRVSVLEKRDEKIFGAVGGIAGFVGTAVGAAILFVFQKLKGE